jgi:hypothetical protein
LTRVPTTIDEVSKVLRDTAYVAIGFGVIAFQKAQVQRIEVQRSLQDNVKLVEERLRAFAER